MPNQTQIAAGLGVTKALVTRYAKQGMPVDSIANARAWKAENIRPRVRIGEKKVPKPQEPVPANPYQEARTSMAIAEAQEAQLRLLERQGVLVHVDVHRARMARHLSTLRDALLQMPARLQSVLAAESDESKCHNIVQDEVFALLARVTEAP